MPHSGRYYKKTLKRNAVMSRNIASMLQPKVLRTNDSSNAVLNNNQILYNNPLVFLKQTRVKKKKMLRNNKKAVQMTAKVKLYGYLKISIPWKMFMNQIFIFQVVLIPLSKPQSSSTPDIKKSNDSKLVSYEIRFPDFYLSSVKNGWLCKICC